MYDFLPNLFVLGAAKCGTTTLHSSLSNMPEICMSDPKEPFFFECEYERELEYYRKTYFPHWHGEKIIGESRHRNLYLPYVPERIYKVNPETKLIVILRNPIDRAMSHWKHWYSSSLGLEKLKFSEALMEDYERIKSGLCMESEEERRQYCRALATDDKKTGYGIYRTYLDSGYYYNQIKRYAHLFPSENILIIFFDDLISKQQEVLARLRLFLGLCPNSYIVPNIIHENIGETRFYRKAWNLLTKLRVGKFVPDSFKSFIRTLLKKVEPKYEMGPEIRKWLYDHYFEHNRALEKFLNCDLSHWR